MPRNEFDRTLVPLVVAGVLLLHLVVNVATPYGLHRDEFLYMAMGRHLRLWHMDFPPMIAMVARLSHAFGDSLVAVRFVPALAAATITALAALIASELGGGRAAQLIAVAAVVANPLFLRTGNLLQPVVLDQLWWTLGYYVLARLARAPLHADAHRWWIALGATAGVGLLTKFSIAFFAIGAVAGIALTPLRAWLRTPWPWLAALVMIVLGSPSIVGQIALGFPVLGQMHDLRTTQLQRIGAAEFLAGQVLLGPALLLAVVGAWALLAGTLRHYRVVGVATLTSVLVLLALHGKAYYAGPVYPALFAAGAVFFAPAVALDTRASRLRRVLALLVVTSLAVYGVVTLPFGLPVLPPPLMARYAEGMGPKAAVTTNVGKVQALPQDYADMLGWPAQAAAVARVFHALSREEQGRAVIAAGNYGEAGALDFYGPPLGLPPAISSAGSYWFFGPGTRAGDPTLVLADRKAAADLGRLFARVLVVAEVRPPEWKWLVAEERDVVVFRCDAPLQPLQAAWPSLAGR